MLTPPTSPPAPAEPLVLPATRWTLDSIRASCDWLAEYSTSGVWRLLDRYGLRLRWGRVQHYSPDPEYAAKVANLEMCLS